jgi:hypothetical protein
MHFYALSAILRHHVTGGGAMGVRFRSWWQHIKQHPFIVAGIIVVSGLLVALIVVEVRANGTGFAGKTLWDWLQLLAALAIPLVVGFGAVWFTIRLRIATP